MRTNNEYQTTRIWMKTLKGLRHISAETDESIVELLDRLTTQEQQRLQRKDEVMVHYVEFYEMENRGAVDPAPSSEVEGTLLIGTNAALEFESHQSSYGEDSTYIFPAFHNGVRCWLRRDVWNPAYGYSASGTQEEILSFEDGVKLFLEHGVFAFPQPQDNRAEYADALKKLKWD